MGNTLLFFLAATPVQQQIAVCSSILFFFCFSPLSTLHFTLQWILSPLCKKTFCFSLIGSPISFYSNKFFSVYISRFLYSCMFSVCFFQNFFSFIYIVLLSMGLSISQLWKIAEHLRQSIGTREKKVNFKGRKIEQKVRTRVHSNKGYVSCTEWNPSFVVTWYSRVFSVLFVQLDVM